MILEASKDSNESGHEFAAVLRAKDGVIFELLMLPDGGFRGKTSVMVYLHMLPIDLTVVGSVHSHPSSNYYPSKADLDFFGKAGMVNIIAAYPYTDRSWQAYNRSGDKIDLEIVG
jgi:proteasome lid subunit RPN8/RPN11